MKSKDGQQKTGQDQDPAMEQNLEYGMGSGGGPEAEAGLTPEAQGQIGRQLRKAYQDLLEEPLPERFSKLLQELAKGEPKK